MEMINVKGGLRIECVHRFTYQNLKHNHITRILGGMCGSRAQLCAF